MPMIAAKNFSADFGTLVGERRTNIGGQAPLLQLKSWINRHIMGMLCYLFCRHCKSFNSCSCFLQILLAYNGYVNGVGNSILNQTTNMILSKMQSIKEYAESLLFHLRWILAHGEIAFLYAEDLSIYVQRRHQFHPKIHRILEDISEQDCYYWFSQNHENMR